MSNINIANTKGPCTFQNTGNHCVQIANGSGGIVNLFFVDSSEDFPVSKLPFNCNKYTLLVVDESIKTTGVIYIDSKTCFLYSKNKLPSKKLVQKTLDEICEYPVLIAKRNFSQKKCGEDVNAAIGRLYKPEIQKGRIKLNYLIGQRFPQMFLNNNPSLFDIMSSDQHNELDDLHWEIKELDILEKLKLKGD